MSTATTMDDNEALGDGIAMSVIVVSPGNFSMIRLTVSYLAEQTICDSLELVIVAPSEQELNLIESEVASFHSYQIVEVGDILFRGKASASGVRVAKGPIVAMAENHAFPTPTWAEVLVEAHKGPWAGVCPQIDIFNPKTLYSRAERFIDYGNWVAPEGPGEIERLPWHNSSYKRDLIMQYEDELETLLEPEDKLQNRLREAGHRFYIEPRAKTLHISGSKASCSFRLNFLVGRVGAAKRSEQWSWTRRLAYVLGSPLFPVIRLIKLRENRRRFNKHHPLITVFPTILALLMTLAVGECAGFLFGAGETDTWLARHEYEMDLRVNADEMLELEKLLIHRTAKHGVQT